MEGLELTVCAARTEGNGEALRGCEMPFLLARDRAARRADLAMV
jgi:hypothetical protein